jgi:hypothetical protein
MPDSISRREWLRALARDEPTHAAAADPPGVPPAAGDDGTLTPLGSTSEVFVPPRGNEYMKFSFDFPEPAVTFGAYRFSFLIFTDENTYGLELGAMEVTLGAGTLELRCRRFVWAGGQETAPGVLTASFRREGARIEWDVNVMMDRPVKSVTTVIRGVPRGRVGFGGGSPAEVGDDELLAGYPFGAGDLHGPGAAMAMTTPVVAIEPQAGRCLALSSLDSRVRPKRFYLQPGESGYRIEAIYEHDGWRNDHHVEVPRWRLLEAASLDEALAPHLEHVERAFHLTRWETRTDLEPWVREIALVTTLHGMHYTGYRFNDYAGMLEILQWIATRIPAERVLVFLPAWDGRYYYDYPAYQVSDRMGGEEGFRRLIAEGQRLGFRLMPMFGLNSANRMLPSWPGIAAGATTKIDGDSYNLNWVDWNNDRHQDGWLAYMNVGHDAWREWLLQRIDEVITRYGVDAYFLDISGGHVNSRSGDMHQGTERLVRELRRRHPKVLCVGEFPYDALHGFIPMFQVGLGAVWRRYSRNFQHLSAPAPGRGSSGVHESGFGRFSLTMSPTSIPTLQVVDDTFRLHRDAMASVIAEARVRAGLGAGGP